MVDERLVRQLSRTVTTHSQPPSRPQPGQRRIELVARLVHTHRVRAPPRRPARAPPKGPGPLHAPYARSRPAGGSRHSRAAARRASVTAARRHRRSSAASSASRWTPGTVYISDPGHNRVRQVGRGGTITTFEGSGVPGSSRDGDRATSAWLTFPMGLAVDGKGNVYIADRDDNRVRKVWKGPLPAGARPKPSPSAGGVTRGTFKTPSGNIVCAFSPEYVGCGIKSGLEPPPPPTRPGCSRADRVFLAATGPARTGGSYCPGEDAPDAGLSPGNLRLRCSPTARRGVAAAFAVHRRSRG